MNMKSSSIRQQVYFIDCTHGDIGLSGYCIHPCARLNIVGAGKECEIDPAHIEEQGKRWSSTNK